MFTTNPYELRRLDRPRPLTLKDILHPTPNFAVFLNTYLERVPLAKLLKPYTYCICCRMRMCNELHKFIGTAPSRPKNDPPKPEEARPVVGRHPIVYRALDPIEPRDPARQKNSPEIPTLWSSQAMARKPPPRQTELVGGVCRDIDSCEIPIAVQMPGCGHIFGSKCLRRLLSRPGLLKCPICKTLWWKWEDRAMRGTVLRESWPY